MSKQESWSSSYSPGRFIDLNADVGESFGAYSHGYDAELMPCITSANIACGWHAGDAATMQRTVELARQYGVAVGAHPGLPDLLGFGRRDMALTPEEARQYVIYQMGALSGFTKAAGVSLRHVKLHGALYNMAMRDEKLAYSIVAGIARAQPEAIILALPGSAVLEAAGHFGVRAAREAFADRAYLADGSLAPRKMPGAVIIDSRVAADRAVRFAVERRIEAITGEIIEVAADTICVHGDNPAAVALVAAIREALTNAGVQVRALHEFL